MNACMLDDDDYRAFLEMSDGEFAKHLLRNSAIARLARKSDHWTLLHHAAFDASAKRCRLLIQAGANPNAVNYDIHCLPLHYAAQKSSECVRLLVEANSNVNARDAYERVPLHWAAGAPVPDVSDIIQILVNAGSDLNALDEQQQTPLLTAACLGNVPAVDSFLDHEADTAARDINGDRLMEYLQVGGWFEKAPLFPPQQREMPPAMREQERLRLIERIRR